MKMNPVPSPLPAIRQNQVKEWKHYVERIARLAVEEDRNALAMGDEFLEVEQTFGKERVYEMAAQTGVGKAKARQRVAVSRKIPKDHPLRNTHLSFSHLRVLVTTNDKMEEWADLCLKNEWTVEELDEQIKQTGDAEAQEDGIPCIQCKDPIRLKETMICFSIQGQKRGRLCGPRCAEIYFHALAETQTEDSSSDQSSLEGNAAVTSENEWPLKTEMIPTENDPILDQTDADEAPRKNRSKKQPVIAIGSDNAYSIFDSRD